MTHDGLLLADEGDDSLVLTAGVRATVLPPGVGQQDVPMGVKGQETARRLAQLHEPGGNMKMNFTEMSRTYALSFCSWGVWAKLVCSKIHVCSKLHAQLFWIKQDLILAYAVIGITFVWLVQYYVNYVQLPDGQVEIQIYHYL